MYKDITDIQLKFYLLFEMPYDNDGSVNLDLLCERYNTELANNLGNLVSRTQAMILKYHSGKLENKNVIDMIDEDLKKSILSNVEKTIKCIENLHIADAIDSAFNIFRRLNKYIDETEPWVLSKESKNDDIKDLRKYILICKEKAESKLKELQNNNKQNNIVNKNNTNKRK